MNDKIKQYWEDRAKENAGSLNATTNDVYLRELEITTLVETLREIGIAEGASVMDVGCGDGYSTIRVAESFPKALFHGIDYSEHMIETATKRSASNPETGPRLSFGVGDVMQLSRSRAAASCDVVMTDRCLINLSSLEDQAQAISEIAACIRPGGHYVAIENFAEGQDELTRARAAMGLPEIPVRWHNLYFREEEFVSVVKQHFNVLRFKDFASSYYFATRVIYSEMCQMRGETPDYQHEIHRLAIRLPWTGRFSPIRLALLQKKTESEEQMGAHS